ncbi:hypothetical protein TEA_016571 [Camellia sinensis var. sinensis]|uniref:18S rRNA cytosine acetyltransferase n=1 Tax=Camellia sinensis var. sinensis TaxID=542762 RepID=A0A4S4D729_CAMSN|nr:hypothetical protein TEA_016571 [Camellia sinensis var. sinensis]
MTPPYSVLYNVMTPPYSVLYNVMTPPYSVLYNVMTPPYSVLYNVMTPPYSVLYNVMTPPYSVLYNVMTPPYSVLYNVMTPPSSVFTNGLTRPYSVSYPFLFYDIHERFRTESHSEIVPRFNERFLLSLASCTACLVVDDELNILPISSHVKSTTVSSIIEASFLFCFVEYCRRLLNVLPGCDSQPGADQELLHLKAQLHDVFHVGPLVGMCTTFDQGKAVSTFLDAVLDKKPQSTTALIAPRGRGKSAALGLGIAGAIASGYSNIFVTAPTPQNLKSLFEFICRGLHVLKYEEHLHYDLLRTSNPDYQKAITQINIFKQHRQTVQYIQPHDHVKLSQVELLVIDEAAAIPLAIVRTLLGPYLVFLSSTVNGYEGTGRSLSLKLLSHLEKQSQIKVSSTNDSHNGPNLFLASIYGSIYSFLKSLRKDQYFHLLVTVGFFQKLELKESIRYASGDPIETWLNSLLCLDITNSIPPISRFPHPSECNLYYVNKDTLFSFHRESEAFLQQNSVASFYAGPVDESKNILPDILCVIQVCLEGKISRDSALQSLRMGRQPSGDQLAWKFCEVFEDTDFPTLSGARIVRIAVHPYALGHGYGSAALDQLTRYYEGQLTPNSESDIKKPDDINVQVSLLEETVTPRKNLPAMLIPLRERLPESLHYIGASFGLTADLFRFWKKHKFSPFYICDHPNNVTGEHSCMVLKPLNTDEIEDSGNGPVGFLSPFHQRFKLCFVRRLPLFFRELDYKLAMSILDPKINFSEGEPSVSSKDESTMLMKLIILPDDIKLLEAYTNNRKDYGQVRPLVPILAQCYFQEKLPITLSYLQASVLLCMGLQIQDITDIKTAEFRGYLCYFQEKLPITLSYLQASVLLCMGLQIQDITDIKVSLMPHSISVEDDLDDGAKQVMEKMKVDNAGLLKLESLQQYCIADREAGFEQTLRTCMTISPSGLISVKSNSSKKEKVGKNSKTAESKKRKRKSNL